MSSRGKLKPIAHFSRPASRSEPMVEAGTVTRRRCLSIIAALGGAAFVPGSIARVALARQPALWRGFALGAPASIAIHGAENGAAAPLIDAAMKEIARLERIFSLHLPDSALVRLNRNGELPDAPPELIRLLSIAHSISEETGGAFDATVQPLWQLYMHHFADHPAARSGPPRHTLEKALARVNFRSVGIRGSSVRLERQGMAVTLNGIAQGFITDAVADLLRCAGASHVLVNLGELRALDTHPGGEAWRVGIAAPGERDEVIRKIEVVDGAVATSAPLGTPFEASGRFNHLLDPRRGASAGRYQSVTVQAPSATLADGLSTAFSLMDASQISETCARFGTLRIYCLEKGGDWRVIEA